jgi:hypothetical protein
MSQIIDGKGIPDGHGGVILVDVMSKPTPEEIAEKKQRDATTKFTYKPYPHLPKSMQPEMKVE